MTEVLNSVQNEHIICIKTMTGKDALFQCIKNTKTARDILEALFHFANYAYLHCGEYIKDPNQFTFVVGDIKLTEEECTSKDYLDQLGETPLQLIHKEVKLETINNKEFKPDEMTDCLNIRFPSGKFHLIKCNIMNHTVYDLKILISRNQGISEDLQRIIFKTKQLEDDKLLSYYNIENNSDLHLVMRLCGGMYHEVSGRDGSYQPLKDIFFIL